MYIKRVLVIDDQVTARLATAEALTVPGIAVHYGSSALSEIPAETPDLIVVGVAMPDSDGLPVVSKVGERFPGVPQLLFAIEPQTLHFNAFAAAGVVGLVPKNVMPAILRKAVFSLLGLGRG